MNSNRTLGYPDDARLLIVNADDLGMCHSVNTGIRQALDAGLIRSTSVMTPCPWAHDALRWLAAFPDVSVAVHLTVICEAAGLRWGPVAERHRVTSLLAEHGGFFDYERIPVFLARAKPREIEIEFRSQIEVVLASGVKPTHLDWHCIHNGGRADIFDLTLGLAREYGLAMRASDEPNVSRLHGLGLPANENGVLDSFRLDLADKSERYAQLLRELPPGLSEWAVHPGVDCAEMRAVQPEGARVRQTDLDFVTSTQARELIRAEGIVMLNYRPLQAAWLR